MEPEEYACPVSIINTTEESIEITTQLVTLSEIQVSDCMSVLTLQTSDTNTKKTSKQLRLEHLNNEEKKIIEKNLQRFLWHISS